MDNVVSWIIELNLGSFSKSHQQGSCLVNLKMEFSKCYHLLFGIRYDVVKNDPIHIHTLKYLVIRMQLKQDMLLTLSGRL
jgi:hypothetical protein